MRVLFLDESGDHNLSAIDPSYPIFVLGGIIVDKEHAEGPLTEAFNGFKREMFGRTDIVLHTADIARNRNGFEELQNSEFRTRFYGELNSLMERLRYEVVACAVRKEDYFARYGANAIDPYRLGLRVMVELLCNAVGPVTGGGAIVAERRGESLDEDVEQTWEILRTRGSLYAEPDVIRDRIHTLELCHKKGNIPSLQLADLVVTPIGRHISPDPSSLDHTCFFSRVSACASPAPSPANPSVNAASTSGWFPLIRTR